MLGIKYNQRNLLNSEGNDTYFKKRTHLFLMQHIMNNKVMVWSLQMILPLKIFSQVRLSEDRERLRWSWGAKC